MLLFVLIHVQWLCSMLFIQQKRRDIIHASVKFDYGLSFSFPFFIFLSFPLATNWPVDPSTLYSRREESYISLFSLSTKWVFYLMSPFFFPTVMQHFKREEEEAKEKKNKKGRKEKVSKEHFIYELVRHTREIEWNRKGRKQGSSFHLTHIWLPSHEEMNDCYFHLNFSRCSRNYESLQLCSIE